MPGAVPATAYTPVTVAAAAAAPVYPQQHPPSAPTPPAMPRYNYPAVTTKPEPTAAHSVTSVKSESISAASAPAPPEAHKNPYKHAQKAKETVKGSPVKDIKTRARYPVSPPPAAPIKGITTYDKVDSSILLNEVSVFVSIDNLSFSLMFLVIKLTIFWDVFLQLLFVVCGPESRIHYFIVLQ